MKTRIRSVVLGVLALSCLCFASCDSDDGAADIPPELLGWWIEAKADGVLTVDSDGYGWGVLIKTDGSITRIRLDVTNWIIVDDAAGAMFTITQADGGAFETSDGLAGSYGLSTVTNQCLTRFLWVEVAGQPRQHYVLMSKLDKTSGCLDGGEGGEGGGEGGEGGGGGGSTLDWYTSSCSELGGVETPTGACYVSCKSSSDCPTDQLSCVKLRYWTRFACTAKREYRESQGCGPGGWEASATGCSLTCAYPGAHDQCPSGWRCVESYTLDADAFCTGYPGS